MTTLCNNCGSTISANIYFCSTCGTPTPSYYSHSGSSQVDPTAVPGSTDPIDQKIPTDYGSPPYGMPEKNPYGPLNPYAVIPPPPPRRVRPSLLIGIITGIVVSVLILGVVGTFVLLNLKEARNTHTGLASSPHALTPALSPAPSQSCGGAFSDPFHDNLDSRWHWINPNGSGTYTLPTKAPLSISTPPNSDINPDTNFNAPRLLQPISGNFTLETQVSFRGTAFFQGAGILLWQDQTRFLRFELGYWGTKYGLVLQKDENGSFSNDLFPWDRHLSSAGTLALRLQRQADHLTVSWHEPGQPWQIHGEIDMHFTSLSVGLDLVASYYAPQTTVYYSYFKVSCPGL